MKVLLLNGSPRIKGNTYLALKELADELGRQGVESEIINVGKEPVRGCTACGSCYKTGKCVFDDCVNEIAAKLDCADGLILGTPVYYAGMTGQIKSFLDRLFYSAGGKLRHKPAAGVVCARRGGLTATFDELNKYFMINNMPVVSSQYWNQVHGGEPGEALQDIEGMQTMRTLARNMAWLLKCIELGRQNGVEPPAQEPVTYMNFIR